jgi:hypothetical protein
VLETRLTQSLVDAPRGESAPRALWDWVRFVERLDEPERAVLAGLGLSAGPVRRVFLREPVRREQELRGGLTDSQQVELAWHLGRFESTLSESRAPPYR